LKGEYTRDSKEGRGRKPEVPDLKEAIEKKIRKGGKKMENPPRCKERRDIRGKEDPKSLYEKFKQTPGGNWVQRKINNPWETVNDVPRGSEESRIKKE